MLLTNPVCIRKVDTDGCCRVAIATKHSYGDNLSRYALNLLLAICRVDRSVILEPLCIGSHNLGTVASLLVAEINYRLPRCLTAKRITIVLDKAIYEIYIRGCILNPKNAIIVEILQIARVVVLDKSLNGCLLLTLSYRGSLLQPIYNLLNSWRVHTTYLPHLLDNLTILIAHKLRVKAIRYRLRIIGIGSNHTCIECLNLLL